MILTIIIFLIMLSALVLVHEVGHFITARRLGLEVEEFGFGFPPRVWGMKRGRTTYSLNLIPIGGFVKIKGESGEDANARDSFASQSPGARSVVVLAGVVMNILLAFVLLSVAFGIGTSQIIDDGLPSSAHVRDAHIEILSVLKGSPADKAGILSGDTLATIDGQTFASYRDVQAYIKLHSDRSLVIKITRNDNDIEKSVTPKILDEAKGPALGVRLAVVGTVSYSFFSAIGQGIYATGMFLKEIVLAFSLLLVGLFRGIKPTVDVAGPVGVAVLTGEAASRGIAFFLQFAAMLSLNLAVVNALPIPALDGGRFVFIVIEKIRGRAITRRIETAIHNVGFLLLMLLVLVVTVRDVGRFSGTISNVVHKVLGE